MPIHNGKLGRYRSTELPLILIQTQRLCQSILANENNIVYHMLNPHPRLHLPVSPSSMGKGGDGQDACVIREMTLVSPSPPKQLGQYGYTRAPPQICQEMSQQIAAVKTCCSRKRSWGLERATGGGWVSNFKFIH